MAANDVLIADAQKLSQDIFLLTGQKVEVNDPIVVAALIQSALIRRAGLDAEAGIRVAMEKALGELAEVNREQYEIAAKVTKDVKALHALIPIAVLSLMGGVGMVVIMYFGKFPG